MTGASGPAVLYVGSSSSHQDVLWEEPGYRRLFGGLGAVARVLTFDRRGCGLSDPLPEGAEIEMPVRDTLAVLDAEGLTSATLWASSESARVAIRAAVAHPQRFDRLMLFAAPSPSTKAAAMLDPSRLAAYRALIEHSWGEGRVVALFAPSRTGDEVFAAWAARLERATGSPKQALAYLDRSLATDVSGDLARVAVPTLVLHRRDDPLTPVAEGRALAAAIPGARFHELPGTDSLPSTEDPELVRDTVAEFLVGHPVVQRLPSTLLTVLFTDIVDSTSRAAEAGDTRWSELLRTWEQAARQAVVQNGGRWVKSLGDGGLASSPSPEEALQCAAHLRVASRAVGLDVRTGIHAGQVQQRENGDIDGIAVHVAARVAARANPGEILTSSTVRDLVLGSEFAFTERGEHELKGVPGTWRLFALDLQD